MRTALIILLAAALTAALTPSLRRALDHYATYSLPKPDHQGSKYALGGRYVTREEFADYWRPRDSGRPTYEESVV